MILSKVEYTELDLRKLFLEVLYAKSVSVDRLYAKLKKGK